MPRTPPWHCLAGPQCSWRTLQHVAQASSRISMSRRLDACAADQAVAMQTLQQTCGRSVRCVQRSTAVPALPCCMQCMHEQLQACTLMTARHAGLSWCGRWEGQTTAMQFSATGMRAHLWHWSCRSHNDPAHSRSCPTPPPTWWTAQQAQRRAHSRTFPLHQPTQPYVPASIAAGSRTIKLRSAHMIGQLAETQRSKCAEHMYR